MIYPYFDCFRRLHRTPCEMRRFLLGEVFRKIVEVVVSRAPRQSNHAANLCRSLRSG